MKKRARQSHSSSSSPSPSPSPSSSSPSSPQTRTRYSHVPNVKDEWWSPQFKTAFLAFLFFRSMAAVMNGISDCDESMNYWEPTHYMMYGYGLQTWEYSPVYALRSYFYIMIHAFFGNIFNGFFGGSKAFVFYAMRWMLAVVCAFAETFFYSRVMRRFGPTVGFLTFMFLLGSAGMFQASASFLPTTFAMYSFLFALANWFSGKYPWAVFFAAFGVLLGWPFSALIVLPMALDIVLRRPVSAFVYAVLSVVVIMVPMVFVDYVQYRQVVIAVWNILVYNSAGGDSVLYGVEPWHFYFLNSFLNFNIVFILFLLSVPLVLYFALTRPVLYFKYPIYLSGAYIWFGSLSLLPHKEERFLFPMYPLIALGGALATYFILQIIMNVSEKLRKWKFFKLSNITEGLIMIFMILTIFGSLAISFSRTIGQQKFYHAPMDVWLHLHEEELARGNEVAMKYATTSKVINVCVGKEWYRFPSHFFIPHSNNYRSFQKFKFNFVKSTFNGLLPKYYGPYPNGTWTIPTTMNDRNREEMDRYIDPSECHYMVDFDYSGQQEEHYLGAKVVSKNEKKEQVEGVWETVISRDFLVQSESPSYARAFWIPHFSDSHVKYSQYVLLRNSALMKKKKNKKVV